MTKPVIMVIVFVCSCLFSSQAQTLTPDSSYLEAAGSAVSLYTKTISQQSEIYNGPEYTFVFRATKGSPYWQDNSNYITGSIKFNETWYHNLPLLYDVFNNQIVSINIANKYRYILHQHLLSEFILSGHHFVQAKADTVPNALKPGYYELLYTGKSMVLCHWAKQRSETISSQNQIEVNFEDYVTYFIKKGGRFYSVNSQSAVLKVFNDKKKEINAYLKANQIRFKDNKALAISKMAAYYDQHTN